MINRKGVGWRAAAAIVSCLVCFLWVDSVTASPVGGVNEAGRRIPRQTRRMMQPPKPVKTFRGVRILIHTKKKKLGIETTTENRGKNIVTLISGGQFGWKLSVFDRDGHKLSHSAARTKKHIIPHRKLIYLDPGKSIKRIFILSQYYQIPSQGVFYVYVSRWVAGGKWSGGSTIGLVQKFVRSPILKLTLHQGAVPAWKVVHAVPHHKPAPQTQPSNTPPYPKYKVPATGPIAALAALSKAVQASDLDRVKQLCYEKKIKPGYITAMAKEAIVIRRFSLAVQNKFGMNPEKRLTRTHSTPESFSHFLKELNPKTLKIKGNMAKVGVWYIHKGKLLPMPSFAFHFRKVKGHWLLDSWATYKSVFKTKARYRLGVEHKLRQAKMFDSWTHTLAKRHFANLHAFEAFTAPQETAEDHWFMKQSMKLRSKKKGETQGHH